MKDKSDKEKYRKFMRTEHINFLKSTIEEIPASCHRMVEAAHASHYPVPFIFASYIIDGIVFGADVDDFLEADHFRYNLMELNLRYSLRRMVRVDRLYSKGATAAEIMNLRDKSNFVKTYKEFLGREVCYAPEHTDEEIISFVREFHKVIVKPCNLCGGEGIYTLDENNLTPKVIDDLRTGKYLLEELVVQHPKMAAINPSSVNTIRVITILDAEGEMHIEDAYIRAGFPGSLTDNISAGGITYPIDRELGIVIGRGNRGNGWDKYLIHPGSNQIMPGFQVPNWNYVLQMLDKACRVQPNVRRVGWDVAVTEDGALLIEGNQLPAVEEIFEPVYYRALTYLKPKK